MSLIVLMMWVVMMAPTTMAAATTTCFSARKCRGASCRDAALASEGARGSRAPEAAVTRPRQRPRQGLGSARNERPSVRAAAEPQRAVQK
eukprot:1519400-Pyramimonas_sp.AAC.1